MLHDFFTVDVLCRSDLTDGDIRQLEAISRTVLTVVLSSKVGILSLNEVRSSLRPSSSVLLRPRTFRHNGMHGSKALYQAIPETMQRSGNEEWSMKVCVGLCRIAVRIWDKAGAFKGHGAPGTLSIAHFGSIG
jgi:hypothetical protein